MADNDRKPRCFIAMPLTTHDDHVERFAGDKDHWIHVMETIFVPAVEQAGYEAVRPVTKGSHMIHGEIIKHLSTAEIVLCDLSAHNPNVFFELGVRTSLNKPVALVRDEHTSLPFDTSGLNTHEYESTLRGWAVKKQVDLLAQHLRASEESCAGTNPLWRHFGLTITAGVPEAAGSADDARFELIKEDIASLKQIVLSGGGVSQPLRGPSMDSQLPVNLGSALARLLGCTSWQSSLDEESEEITFFFDRPVNRVSAGEIDDEARNFAHELLTVKAEGDRGQRLKLKRLPF